MKKKFLCLFPTGEDIVLVKDVGMIPYYLFKEGYYDSYISFYKPKEELPYLESELQGLKYIQMNNYFNHELLNIFFFLIKNLFRFDVIMLFHPNPYKILMANIIKILSFNRIKFYFKMDTDHRVIDQKLDAQSFGGRIKQFLCKRIDLFSAESQDVSSYLNEHSYYAAVKYIPNGCVLSDNSSQNLRKNNVFLTVGRLGTYQKDTETLLEAFSMICENVDWKLLLVGTLEDSFNNYLKDYFQKYPWTVDKVDILGPIYDRNKLNHIYQQSAVFVLSSRYESFGLVLLEAMSQGCYILSTSLSPAKDILENNKLGTLYPIEGKVELAELMKKVIQYEIALPEAQFPYNYVKKNYSWSIVVNKIASYLDHKTISI
ncbi:glycosyltransferase [Sphingobacterium faecium]